jgi:hypothetical protein
LIETGLKKNRLLAGFFIADDWYLGWHCSGLLYQHQIVPMNDLDLSRVAKQLFYSIA